MSLPDAGRIVIRSHHVMREEEVLTEDALAFVEALECAFGERRRSLLAERRAFGQRVRAGFLPSLENDRFDAWSVRPAPSDLLDRRIEITGPVSRKMMIGAMNSGAQVFMADFEDALSPTWTNVVEGQVNLRDAVRRTITYRDEAGLRSLAAKTATLVVRPRGWHLNERHLLLEGRPISASLVDFGLYFHHNVAELLESGSGPYFYLPKLESAAEAVLWDDVFAFAEDTFGLERGTVRATVLIETIRAAFEMEAILHALRDHVCGLNAGRWDYIFSIIRTFGEDASFLLPDRGQVRMTAPFMRAYTRRLVHVCHRHGAHAIGGMSAYIPRRDVSANALAFGEVQGDKEREAGEGFDGTWIAHPGLVDVARGPFDRVLGERPHQIAASMDPGILDDDLLDVRIPDGRITAEGLERNVSVGIRYLSSWLKGIGAAALDDLMEDAATAEISRAQVWQWAHHHVRLEDGREVTAELVRSLVASLSRDKGDTTDLAARLFSTVSLAEPFVPFLTGPAYEMLTEGGPTS